MEHPTADPHFLRSRRIVEAEATTRRGYSHVHNEDAYMVSLDERLFAIADGMGGHRDGHIASRAVITSLQQRSAATSLEERIDNATHALEDANTTLFGESLANPAAGISGSTAVALLVGEDYACCLWVGDSRLYLMRNEKLYLISEDHAAEGGALTRAIGSSAKVDVDRRIVELADGDLFVLCSDGLLKGMGEDELVGILCDRRENAADRLLAKSIAGGSVDDITLVLVWVLADE
ncbi:PP2C family serine/threonine-protein phosphatase [Neorhizobium sp. T7_12]|uniref:PP2C family protein-serine/threonine phosphatase n=1 Tax=Neorhizobium sp. T7_12 TaxID=2093832 RepID=UPI00155E4393|nr:protein phosphatase 2C domain-containing protein [Neorhizobium sp. T7_12]